jgi:hypothetical protein
MGSGLQSGSQLRRWLNSDISRGTAQLNRTKRLTSVDGIKL